jgi:hypothetical protein
MRDETGRRAYMRKYMRGYRAKKRPVNTENANDSIGKTKPPVNRVNSVNLMLAHTDADVDNTPLPPKRGKLVFPDNLQTPEFQKLWDDFEAHRRAKGAKLTDVARKRALAKLSSWGPSRAIAALGNSLSQGWTGIFEESQKTNNKTKRTEFRL